jgi:transcriptional regulator with XRE-family HTH domain
VDTTLTQEAPVPQGDAPAVARRRIRLALRQARERKELTLNQVAEAIGASISKIIRIEQGGVTVSRGDLQLLLDLYGVDDPAARAALVADVRIARSRPPEWSDADQWRHIPTALQELIQLERSATALRVFHPTLIPGLLQTPGYSDALFRSYAGVLHPKDDAEDAAARDARRRIRLARPAHVIDRADPPQYYAILDESVLYRAIGGTAVLAEQLQHLVAMMERPHVHLRVLPFTAGAPFSLQESFIILELDHGHDAVLYLETYTRDSLNEDDEKTARYRTSFERAWEVSLDDDASTKLISGRAQDLLPS